MSVSGAYQPTKQAAFRKIGEKIVIVHTLDNRLITLNETGSFIWERLSGKDLDRIIDEMIAEFEISEEEARADALDFIAQMKVRGLVEDTP